MTADSLEERFSQEHQGTMNRKWFSIRTFFGLFALSWGSIGLLAICAGFINGFLKGLHGYLAAYQILGKGALAGSLFMSVLWFLWAILLITSGVGILKGQRWSWRLYASLVSLWLCLVPFRFFLYGTFVSWISYDLLLFAPLVLYSLWTIYNSTAVTLFGLSNDTHSKIRKDISGTIKVFAGFWLIYGVTVLGASLAWPYLYRTPQTIHYETSASSPSAFVIKDRRLFAYTLRLPDRFHLSFATFDDQPGGYGDSAVVTDHQRRESIMIHRQNGYDLMKGIDPRHESAYDFSQRYIHEKFSLLFLSLKRIQTSYSTQGKFDEVETSNWRGVVYDSAQKDSTAVTSDFSLWDKRTGQPIEIVFIGKAKKFDSDTMRLILSSLEVTKPPESAATYANVGRRQIEQTAYEDAKFSFSNAIDQNRRNPEYAYYFGKCYYMTKDWSMARNELKRAVSLDSENLKAKALLDKIPIETKPAQK